MLRKASLFSNGVEARLFAGFFLIIQTNRVQGGLSEFEQRSPTFYLSSFWGVENGLPQSSVTSIVQTKDGYIWVGTSGGLARFDGINFTVFDATNTPALRSNRIFRLYEDRAGVLWIGMERGGVVRYANRKFELPEELEELRNETITAIHEDGSGALWIGTENCLFRFQEGKLENISEVSGLPRQAIYSIVEEKDRNLLWIGTASGLIQFQDGHVRMINLSRKKSLNLINDILITENGVYIATKTGIFRSYDGKFILNKGLRNFEVRALHKENVNLLWAATRWGLFLINAETGEPIPYSLNKELPDRGFTTIIRDRENNLWVGMETGGLARLKVASLTVYDAKQELPVNAQNVVPITQDWEGNIWMGLACGGLARLVNERFKIYTSKDGLPNTCVWSLFADEREKSLWIGTWNGGLIRFKDGKFTGYNYQNSGLTSKVVLAIYRDRKGNLWVGTYDGGLNRLVEGRFIAYGKEDGLVSEDIRFITEDSSGALWIGTTGGLSKSENGRFSNYTTENGLSSNNVRAVYEDADGVIWIGTYGGGLNRLKDGRFTHYTKQEGLPDNTISRIIEDEEGNLWMSGNRGIFRVSRRELNEFAEGMISSIMPIHYDNSDGMKTRETNGGSQPAGWRTQDGRLWFPTLKGAVVIDPKRMQTNKLIPPVFIEEVIVNKKRIENLENIELTSGAFNLEIRYTGLSFVAPEKMRFKYMLEGYDSEWIDNLHRTAFYTNLPPGNFRFRVIASNSDGIWNLNGATLRIKVLPRFYQTWWFYISVISAVLLSISIIYSLRITHLKQMQKTQALFSKQLIESQEKERKRIAVELHDSLGQSLILIKNYSVFGLKQKSNELKIAEQLHKIIATVTQALAEVRRISYDLRPYYLEKMGLKEAIEAMIEKIAESSNINFSFEIADLNNLFSEEEEINLYRIVQEGLNNIVQHSGATKARVEIKRNERSIDLTISDNGRGFNLESQFQDKRNHLGLISMAERTRMLGGTYSIRTAKGKGTTISIKISVSHLKKDEK